MQKAPEVRHLRSPWPLHSGGHGLKASMKNGSAVVSAIWLDKYLFIADVMVFD